MSPGKNRFCGEDACLTGVLPELPNKISLRRVGSHVRKISLIIAGRRKRAMKMAQANDQQNHCNSLLSRKQNLLCCSCSYDISHIPDMQTIRDNFMNNIKAYEAPSFP